MEDIKHSERPSNGGVRTERGKARPKISKGDDTSSSAPDRHKLEVVFRESPAAMALWRGRDLIFEMVNPVYQAIFGDRQLLGKPIIEAIPELEEQEFPQLLLRVLETGEPFVGREILARLAPYEGAPLQDFFFDFTYVRVDDVNGKPWGVYDHATDVTDRVLTRRKNEELLAENRRLLESEREARNRAEEASRAKDDFLATISHELRTPLSSILGWSQLLLEGSPTPEAVIEGLKSIEQNARMQKLLIEDILELGRLGSGSLRLNIRPAQPEEIIGSAIETVSPAASAKGISLRSHIDPTAAKAVPLDPERMQQVMWNLLSNAIKFTPPGGSVQVQALLDGSELRITVEDDGEGISAEILPHIFDRFRQGDDSARRHGGLGLGLSIVRQLIELHGGTVDAASSGQNCGSQFMLRIPVRPAS